MPHSARIIADRMDPTQFYYVPPKLFTVIVIRPCALLGQMREDLGLLTSGDGDDDDDDDS